MDQRQHATVDAGSEHIPVVTNLPRVESREQLSAVTNLVIMSGSERDNAFVHLRKLVHISEQQEEAIRLAIKRTYQNAQINPYYRGKKRGRPAGTTNKPGHKAGRPPKSKRAQAAGSNLLSVMCAASSGNTVSNEVAENAGNSEHEQSSEEQIQPAAEDEVLSVAANDSAEQIRRDDALTKLQTFVESIPNGSFVSHLPLVDDDDEGGLSLDIDSDDDSDYGEDEEVEEDG